MERPTQLQDFRFRRSLSLGIWTDIRRGASDLAFLLGIRGLTLRRLRGAAILCFHGVTSAVVDPELEEYSVTADYLDDLLTWLRRHVRVVPIERALRDPISTPPAVSLVFDDGYANLAEFAAPILERHAVPWAIAVPTRLVGGGRIELALHFAAVLRYARRSSLKIRWNPESATCDIDSSDATSVSDAVLHFRSLLRNGSASDAARVLDELLRSLGPDEPSTRVPEFLRLSTEAELDQCVTRGAVLLSHGASHLPFDSLGPDGALAEWRESIAWLASRWPDHTMREAVVLPYGRANPAVAAALTSEGCRFVLTGARGWVDAGTRGIEIPRIAGQGRKTSTVAARLVSDA